MEKETEATTKGDAFYHRVSGVLLAIVVLIFCGWIWCWILPGYCWFCPRCPPPCPPDVPCPGTDCEVGDATIHLEDSHTGMFTVIDNAFVEIPDGERVADKKEYNTNKVCGGTSSVERKCEWPPRAIDDHATGLLFQMGNVQGLDHFGGLEIYHDAAPDGEKIVEGDFDWVDVNPESYPCTVDPFHAYSLFGLPGSVVVGTECDNATVSGGPETCLRGRSIHSMLSATHAITYWAGEDYYGMVASKGTSDEKFVFDLYDPVVVERWLEGCLEEIYTGVTKIVIVYEAPSDHGSLDQPPMDGGTPVYPPG